MVGEMRTRITIKTPTTSKDAGGGTSTTYDTGYPLWAHKFDRTGSAAYTNGQRQVTYDVRYKVRYFASAPITTGNIVVDAGVNYKITSVERESEGKLRYCYLNCVVHGGT